MKVPGGGSGRGRREWAGGQITHQVTTGCSHVDCSVAIFIGVIDDGGSIRWLHGSHNEDKEIPQQSWESPGYRGVETGLTRLGRREDMYYKWTCEGTGGH